MPDYQPKPIPALSAEDVGRFWEKVIRGQPDECWPWFGGVSGDGYGTFWIGRKSFKAHRVVYAIAKGVDPEPFLMRHKCDHKWCCNPEHLIPGTHRENSADAVARNRRPSGREIFSAVLDEERVAEVLKDRAAGMTYQKLSAKYGVTMGSLIPIVRGKTWKRVIGPRDKGKRQLTEETRVEIRKRRAQGATLMFLAREFHMSLGAVGMLCAGQTWAKDKGV